MIRLRAELRARRARLGGSAHPARLLIRLDDLNAPGPDPGPGILPQAEVHRFIVAAVMWGGALPVRVVGRADNPRVADTVRFAWRLECPVRLRTNARGLADRAELLVDSGLRELRVAVAGPRQEAACGDTEAEVHQALAALRRAKEERRAQYPTVIAEVPISPETADVVPAVLRTMRDAGADAVELTPPFRGPAVEESQWVLLDVAAVDRPPFHRTPEAVLASLREPASGDAPGNPRRRGRDGASCPLGTLQIELTAQGALRSCPFHADMTPWNGDISADWARLAAHRGHIRSCERRCLHPDLTPW